MPRLPHALLITCEHGGNRVPHAYRNLFASASRLLQSHRGYDAGALALAREIARFPQRCLRSDRLSAYEQWSLSYEEALRNELRRGLEVLESGETHAGATAFARGQGRHGVF